MRPTLTLTVLFILAPLIAPLAVCAAVPSPLDGTWNVTFSTRDTEERRATVVIAGAEGTWTTLARFGKDKHDPCVSRRFPLTVSSADPDRLVFEVAAEKELAECKNRTVTGRLVDAATIEGSLENGKPLRMIRR